VVGFGAVDVGFDRGTLRTADSGALHTTSARDVTVTDSAITGAVIVATGSNAVTLSRNRVADARIGLNQTNDVIFSDNRLVRSNIDAINCNRFAVLRNRITDAGTALTLGGGTYDTRVSGNDFTGNAVAVWVAPFIFIDEVAGTLIDGNRIRGNSGTGILVEAAEVLGGANVTISGNTVARNGHGVGALVDGAGHPMDDGIHVDVPPSSGVVLTGNRTARNADHGIEAQPGTVQDGGGNTSRRDPNGCLGVICTS
ncbi:right-handed parallel beta-helix repeat-containing protein, partial [Actinomadura adrarensis]